MDKIISVIRRSLKRKREPESEDQNEASQVVRVEDQNEDGTVFTALIADEEATEATARQVDVDNKYVAAGEANREAWAEVVIARFEVGYGIFYDEDGLQWEQDFRRPRLGDDYREYYYSYKAAPDCPDRKDLNHGCHGVGTRNPFRRLFYLCNSTPKQCPVWKEVQRCSDEPSIFITTYFGTHNHPLPGRGATAKASTALSDGTSSSFTQTYDPYHASYLINQSSHPPNIRSINPDDPSKGIIVDFTSNSNDPPQSPMAKPPVRDEQDQNHAPKIPVVEDPNKYVSYKVYGAAGKANRKAWVEVVIARCEVASLKDGFQWRYQSALQNSSREYYGEYYYSYKAAPDCPDRKELNHGCHEVGARNPFPRHSYWCNWTPKNCPVRKEVQRCLDEPSILITTYEGTHNHPLPGRGATAMASTALSDGTSSSTFTQTFDPHHASYLINQSSHPPNIRSINPDDPSKGIIVDLTSNSNDPPQSQMAKSPVRDQQDQNHTPKIPVVEDPNKNGTVFAALVDQIEMVRCMHMHVCVRYGWRRLARYSEKVT